MPVAHAALRPQPRGRTTALALALVASFVTTWTIAATTASAAGSCSPPDQQRSANLARAEHRDGSSEVTEYLAHGAYRVTHCAQNGSLLVSQTVTPILDPDGKVVLAPTERQKPGASVAMVYGAPSEKRVLPDPLGHDPCPLARQGRRARPARALPVVSVEAGERAVSWR